MNSIVMSGPTPAASIFTTWGTSRWSFDRIIIKEDQDLRGRQPLEVADKLLDGALQGGIPRDRVILIPEEEKALEAALAGAEPGDVMVMFFEKMEPLVKILEEYRDGSRFSCPIPTASYIGRRSRSRSSVPSNKAPH